MNLEKITKTYYLPKKLRPVLKRVWGIPVLGENHTVFKKCQKIIKQKGFKKIITVGDYCSLSLPSDVKIFDNKIQRKVVENNLPYSLKLVNPAGTINKQAWKIIDQAIRQEKNIFVKGEEDLLVIPAVLLSSKGIAIIYGLPKKGVCLIESSSKIKKELKELLKKFDTK
ncbi:MAG: DUF359 domain-containing protein [Patescibacteria group bacterium]|nr:DUF359 domain-containing protein [Patescibacteria group bacterium]